MFDVNGNASCSQLETSMLTSMLNFSSSMLKCITVNLNVNFEVRTSVVPSSMLTLLLALLFTSMLNFHRYMYSINGFDVNITANFNVNLDALMLNFNSST